MPTPDPAPARQVPRPSQPSHTPQRVLAEAATALTALLAAVVLVGWALDLPMLRSLIPGAVEMKANTAVGLMAVSCAVLLIASLPFPGSRGLADALAVMVVLLGTATLAEYAFGHQLGIDEWLVKDTGAAFNQAKGRMSPYSAVAFVALGFATVGLLRRRMALAVRSAATVATVIGIVSLIGYLWNASEIVSDRVAPPVAINTAFGFILLGTAVLLLSMPRPGAVPHRERSRLERLILGGMVPTALLAVVGGGLTYQSGANFALAAERVAHTQEVRATLASLYGSITDAEAARRNHLSTQDSTYLNEFLDRAARARHQVATLGGLVADNAAQAQLQRQLAGLIEARLHALDAMQPGALAGNAPDATTAQIRQLSRRMDEAEGMLLNARLVRTQEQRQVTLISLLVTLLLLTVLLVLLFRTIQREVQARSRIEQDMHRLNASLEQRVAERTDELSFQQAFLRRVIDLNPNLVFAKDAEGRFVLANQALADALDTSVDQLVGQREHEYSAGGAEVAQFESADRQVIASGQDLVIPEEEFTDAHGALRWLSTVKRPILSPDGATTIVLGVSTDITARKQAEAEVRLLADDLERRVEARTLDLHESNQKLEQARRESEAASRAKSAFLANMSHEIRTPMNAIIGMTHLMLREAVGDRVRGRLTKVGDAAQHLLKVINDILDMSKIEAGKLTLEDTEFSLDALLTSATEMVTVRARDKGLELILDTEHLPDRLRGDPTRLAQVLINLLSNAVKFTASGWVRLRGEVVREDGDRLLVRFEVRDTGPGIAAAEQLGLFQAFEQADNSASRQHGGTGLGLALSRQIALAMGGDAGVISALGAGSTFWFTAWVSRGAEVPHSPTALAITGLRALLVDDLPESLDALGARLRSMGLEVDALSSVAAAASVVEARVAAGLSYDVMLVDWRAQAAEGIEALLRLRELMGGDTPPGILVSSSDAPEVFEQARQLNCDAVLLKPITASALHETLTDVLRKRAAALPAAAPEVSDAEKLLRLRHGGQRVLLAEDNPINREVAEALLHAVALVVETAADGAEAAELALLRHYDLVLMDMQMPVMDGLQAARTIRARGLLTTPIIAMTANAFNEDREACLAAGMNDHVAKPVDPQLLYETLLRWMPHAAAAKSAPASA